MNNTHPAYAPVPVQGVGDLIQAPGSKQRPIYTYKVPAAISGEATGITSVGLVELEAGEELMAAKRAQSNPVILSWELAKQSLCRIDGKRVGQEDGSVEVAWSRMGAKLRTLVCTAYARIHNPEKDELDSFLQSMEVTV